MNISAVEILGLFAGFLTAFSSVPQSLKIIKLKQAEAVSTLTFGMLVGSYILWLVYGLIMGSVSIVFWNVIALLLGGTVLVLKLFIWNKS
jgi:MtN3 and saliva related transmembrane protein